MIEMKKCVFVIVCALVLCAGVVAAFGLESEYTLEPGRYTVGEDIPSGYYDIRIKGLDQYCTIRHSVDVNIDGTLNMDTMYAYEFTFKSTENYWQGCHPNILLTDGDYIEIENSRCVFYPIERSQF